MVVSAEAEAEAGMSSVGVVTPWHDTSRQEREEVVVCSCGLHMPGKKSR